MPASKISLFGSQMTKTPDLKKVDLPLPNAEKNQVDFGISGGPFTFSKHLVGVSRIFLKKITLKCNGLLGVHFFVGKRLAKMARNKFVCSTAWW